MLTVRTPRELRAALGPHRRAGRRVGFVPTMGYLHEGHLSLVREARARTDVVVASIFVNPIQFGPGEDLARYPRDEAGDAAKLAGAGCDVLYLPAPEAVYPVGFSTHVEVGGPSAGLCGDRRPGHFRGVATVVAKLLHLVAPDVAVFGQKDYQQLAVIRRMVRDLDFDVEIVGCPIVREPDGLAMSSRNAYLSAADRPRALALSRGLEAAAIAHGGGERSAKALEAIARAPLEAAGLRVDYVEARDATSLEPVGRCEDPVVIAVAAFVGSTRLIDNRVLPGP